MNVRGMQPRLAAAFARPRRFWANQPHAGAAGVEVYLPLGGKKGRDPLGCKVLRRTVRAVDHPQLAYRPDGRMQRRRQGRAAAGIG